MGRKKVKLAWVENDNSRAISLKKRSVGLRKKIKELTILCGVKACMIMFNPNDAEPMMWPSAETACGLLDHFFGLPEIEQKKKETNLESYLKEKTKKVREQLMKSRKKNMEYVINQPMMKLVRGHNILDLKLSEIYALISFLRDKIILFRKRLNLVECPPLRVPPMVPFDVDFHEFRTTKNDVVIQGVQGDERGSKKEELARRINIDTFKENKSHYLIDQWFSAPELPNNVLYQQTGMELVSYNENLNSTSYHSYQGSSSNGISNLEMNPVGPQLMNFHGFLGSVSQPLQQYSMKNDSIMAISQPRPYPFDFMIHDLSVKEEGSIINNKQFHESNNIIVTNNGVCQESPPKGTSPSKGNIDVVV